MAQKILVTGASGFIGSHLVEYGIQQGHKMYAGVRKSSNLQYLNELETNIVYLDFKDKNGLTQTLHSEQFDLIIHCAGITKTPNRQEYYTVNCVYVQHIIEGIKRVSPQTAFIFMSSIAAYGPAEKQSSAILDEQSIPYPVTHYGKSKLRAEEYLANSTFENYTIFRPTVVYGPREKELLLLFKLLNKRLELFIGHNKQKLSFVYIADLVKVVYQSSTKNHSGLSYFVSDGDFHSAEALHQFIKKHLNKKSLKIKLRVNFVGFLASFLEKIGRLVGKYPALNKEKLNELECLSWNCDIRSLVKEFNFDPHYNLDRGIEETVQWYKNNNWL